MSSSIFLSCSNPFTVSTSKGLVNVPCGHCVQCMQKKVSSTTLLLDLESQNAKYVEMINLTYCDDCLPYIDFNDDSHANFSENYPNEIFPIKFGSARSILKYNPRTKKYYTTSEMLHDSVAVFSYDWAHYLSIYNKRVDEYYSRFPNRSRGISRLRNHVPILFPDDIRKYMYRLRQYLKKNYEIEIRFFAVGEYGSNSLRPHWHILLFHNSNQLRESFRNVVDLPGHTTDNPRQCCREFYLHPLWLHGATTTKCTDKHASSYLAGYFNQHSNVSPLVKDFPPKSFHSKFLGMGELSQSQKASFLAKDWESFITRSLVTKRGVQKNVSLSSALYSQFNLQFTGYAKYNVDQTFQLLSDVFSVYKATQVNYNDEVELYKFYLSSFKINFTNARLSRAFSSVRSYITDVVNPILYDSHNHFTLSSLKSLFYASVRLYRNADFFGLHPLTYLRTLDSFKSYLDYQRLIGLFTLLQSSPVATEEYYSSFSVTGTHDIQKVKYKPIFLSMLNDAVIEYDKSIKHRDVVDSYINSQLDI